MLCYGIHHCHYGYNKRMETQTENPVRPPRFLPVLVVLFALLFFAMIAAAMRQKTADLPEDNLVGKVAPEFTVERLEPENRSVNVSLPDLLAYGKPVIINLWASWCGGCAAEADDLEQFWLEHRDDVTMIGIAIQDRREDALDFADRFHATYPLALDTGGRVGIDYAITGLPETLVLDSTGIVRHRFIGAVTRGQLATVVSRIGDAS
ncbi:MAG: TlpA family protein disulfide reductase [Candidatus Dadabacteria bacterium]|nr:MAG: TlpA family protein disulfide reductase [Candidatus Dadabacteria bacterium]